MNTLSIQIEDYLNYCQKQKKLNEKTLKAYRIDLAQFESYAAGEPNPLTKHCITKYIQELHQKFKAKTVKRKIACIRAFTNYLEFEEQIESNPIDKIRLKFQEPTVLPKSLPLKTMQKLLSVAHHALDKAQAESEYQYGMTLRDAAILELLFATGLRVSELCSITVNDLDLQNGVLKVHGKGSKERLIFITNKDTLSLLRQYKKKFTPKMSNGWFFINRLNSKLSEQSVRNVIQNYSKLAKIPEHITPHTIRHSFATLMLEEDVDIRYIQSILGHSSISTTQIYTHVSLEKQRKIMAKKHPRNRMSI